MQGHGVSAEARVLDYHPVFKGNGCQWILRGPCIGEGCYKPPLDLGCCTFVPGRFNNVIYILHLACWDENRSWCSDLTTRSVRSLSKFKRFRKKPVLTSCQPVLHAIDFESRVTAPITALPMKTFLSKIPLPFGGK